MSDFPPINEPVTLFNLDAVEWFGANYFGGSLVLSAVQAFIASEFGTGVGLQYAVVAHEDDVSMPPLIVEVGAPVDDPSAWASLSRVTAAVVAASAANSNQPQETYDAIVLTLGGAPRDRRAARRRGLSF